ncbi:MAG: hypothetical protein A4E66_02539 [Syntrophus sp. PtaB.Bin001]|nr:MAG: hypothetical protein A4E66_02539 [Syntrophus sp. PtaB.Bin001]
MTGKDKDFVPQRQQPAVNGIVKKPGHLRHPVFSEKINPAHVPGKKGVPRKDHPGVAAVFVKQVTHAARRMPRRVDRFQLQTADFPGLTVAHRLPVFIIPLSVGMPYLRTGTGGQFHGTKNKILMPVSFQDGYYTISLERRRFQIYFDVAAGIDNHRLATVADKIGILGKSFRLNPLKKHRHLLEAL